MREMFALIVVGILFLSICSAVMDGMDSLLLAIILLALGYLLLYAEILLLEKLAKKRKQPLGVNTKQGERAITREKTNLTERA